MSRRAETAPVVIVTGGSSGIGKSTALALVACGCRVYEFSRRDGSVPGVTHLTADVTDEAAVEAAVWQVAEREGRIDVLINNAGFGISGAVEFTETKDAKRLLDVNFFGMVRMNRAVIPVMRRQGSGRIVNLSSVAAPIPIPFQTYYSCSKAAINAYTMALANEVRPYGITVCAVQPGDIRTGFTDARKKSSVGNDVYGGRIEKSVRGMEHDERNGMRPESVGRFICRVAQKNSHKPIYTIGAQYKIFCSIAKLLPLRLLNFFVGRLYAS